MSALQVGGQRVYAVQASLPEGVLLRKDSLRSDLRIGALARLAFRSLFGAAPAFCWHADGRAAEAWGAHGERLVVKQINHHDGR